MYTYTTIYLKSKTVTLSSEKIKLGGEIVKEFTAHFKNSLINFVVPEEIIKVLGRLLQKNDHLELGYIVEKDIWFILQKDCLLWSDRIFKLMQKNKKPKFNRYTALTKKN